jgi:hypothetical protein
VKAMTIPIASSAAGAAAVAAVAAVPLISRPKASKIDVQRSGKNTFERVLSMIGKIKID